MADRLDIVIIGGGLVGASLACALSGQGLRIAVVEGVRADERPGSSYDDRAIALAYGSRRILDAMALWSDLVPAAAPIRNIHVSDRGHFGAARLSSEEEGVEALGYVVTARDIGRVLLAKQRLLTDVRWYCPGVVEAFRVVPEHVDLQVGCAGETIPLRARLLLVCDGGNSVVRERLGIGSKRWPYGHSAIATNVTPELDHCQVAYERFTANGPLAFLPMRNRRCSVVWTVPEESCDEIMALSDAAFIDRLQHQFGSRLGCLQRVGSRHAYPLNLVRAQETVRPRVVLLGNAARTVHPVAGQGFNLGLRDVAALADVLADCTDRGEDLGALSVLQRYALRRRADQRSVIAFTDFLARTFSIPFAPVAVGRNLGLLAFDLLPDLKHHFSRRTMGIAGRLPRLARGLPVGGRE